MSPFPNSSIDAIDSAVSLTPFPDNSRAAWERPIPFPVVPPVSDVSPDVADTQPLETDTLVATELVPVAVQSPEPEQVSQPVVAYQRGETAGIWGLKLDCVCMAQAVEGIAAMIRDRSPRYVITANLNYAMLNDADQSLRPITDGASMVLADGKPMVWRSKIGAQTPLPERVAGSELIYELAARAAKEGWRIYFLGALPGVAQRCADVLAKAYPGMQVAGVQSPPYRKMNEEEEAAMLDHIRDSNPDILLVAFGQPKGEKWIVEHHEALGVPVSIQLGASFDFIAGTAKRAPKIWQRFGLEWAYRMSTDPLRLVPRYAANAGFLGISLVRDWRDFVNGRFGVSQ